MEKRKQIHLLAGIAVFIVMKLILPADTEMGLTKAGASALAVFAATIYVWLTVGVDWTSFLVVGLLAFTGIAPAASLWQMSWGNSLTILVITVTILSYAVNKTGIAQRVAAWFITRKVVEKRPYVFFLFFMLSNLLVGYVMDATPTTVIFGLIAKSILDDLGYSKDDKFSKVLFIIVFWITSIGYCATPISHPIPLLVIGMVENAIGPVSYLKYIAVGIPYSILFFILTFLIIRFVIKPDCTKFENYDVAKKRAEIQPLSKQGKIVAAAYAAVIVCWLFPDVMMPLLPAAAGYMKALGNVLPPLIAVAVLCIVRVDNEPCLVFSEAMKNAPWTAIPFIATIMTFSSVISLESGGINIFLTNLVSPIAAMLSPQMLAAVALLIGLVLTNFMSNGVAATVTFSAFVPVMLASAGSSVSMVGFGVMLAFFVNTAYMTPSANAVAPLIFQYPYLTMGDALKYGTIVVALTYILSMVLIWPLAQFVF